MDLSILDGLSSRQRTAIMLRCGIEGERLTLERCSAKLGVTRERVRQIQAEAMDALRADRKVSEHPDYVKLLEYLVGWR